MRFTKNDFKYSQLLNVNGYLAFLLESYQTKFFQTIYYIVGENEMSHHDKIVDNVLEAIGGTPLIRLQRMTEGLSAEILVKYEAMNPGGSIKDRAAKKMIEKAIKTGQLKSGGTIIEATAGNTGTGLAQAAAVYGFRTIFVLPDKMSKEKISLLQAYGAETVITPTSVPADSPESYNGVADRLSREIPGAFRPSQFDNPENTKAHFEGTGPEIWEQTNGQLDVLVAGMGTGGTISGTGGFLKKQNPKIIVVGADPEGSILSGDSPKSWKVEGIGEDFIPKNFNRQVVDEMIRISDHESFQYARRLAREEGILTGGSGGTALAAAFRYAKRITRPHRIVVILPDTGRNYLSKCYDDEWMKQYGFLDDYVSPSRPIAEALTDQTLITLSPENDIETAFELMQQHGISQIPVIENERSVGSVNETTLMWISFSREFTKGLQIRDVMAKPFPELDIETDIDEAYRILFSGQTAILVTKNWKPLQLLTRFDLISFRESNI
jgi:cystathionine beta-synthase